MRGILLGRVDARITIQQMPTGWHLLYTQSKPRAQTPNVAGTLDRSLAVPCARITLGAFDHLIHDKKTSINHQNECGIRFKLILGFREHEQCQSKVSGIAFHGWTVVRGVCAHEMMALLSFTGRGVDRLKLRVGPDQKKLYHGSHNGLSYHRPRIAQTVCEAKSRHTSGTRVCNRLAWRTVATGEHGACQVNHALW